MFPVFKKKDALCRTDHLPASVKFHNHDLSNAHLNAYGSYGLLV